MRNRYRPRPRDNDHHPVLSGPEAAVLAIAGTILAVLLVAVGAVALAAGLFGARPLWPADGGGWLRAIGGILSGDPAGGYPTPDGAPSKAVLYATITVCEALLITAVVLGGRALRRASTDDGMATRSDAEAALGLRELRKARSIIRPDLHPTKRKAGE